MFRYSSSGCVLQLTFDIERRRNVHQSRARIQNKTLPQSAHKRNLPIDPAINFILVLTATSKLLHYPLSKLRSMTLIVSSFQNPSGVFFGGTASFNIINGDMTQNFNQQIYHVENKDSFNYNNSYAEDSYNDNSYQYSKHITFSPRWI